MTNAKDVQAKQGRWSAWHFVQISVSVLMLGLLVSRIDTAALESARQLSPALLLASFGLVALSQVWGGIRLCILLRAQATQVSCASIVQLTFIGFFFNNFSPGTVGGDVAKGFLLVRGKVSTKVGVLALLMDRLINLISVLVMTFACVLLAQLWHVLPTRVLEALVVLGSGLLAMAVVGYLFRARLGGWLGALVPLLRGRLEILTHCGEIVRRWLQAPRVLLIGILLSFAGILSSVIGLWILLPELGIELSLPAYAGIVGIVYFLTLVPISFNGIGVQEVSIVFLMTSAGADQRAAIVLALLARLLMLATSVIGALAFAAHRITESPEPSQATEGDPGTVEVEGSEKLDAPPRVTRDV